MICIYDLKGFLLNRKPRPRHQEAYGTTKIQACNQEYRRLKGVGTQKGSLLHQKGVKRTLVVPGGVWALKNKGVQHQEAGGMILGVRTPESRGRVGMSVIMAYSSHQ